MAATGMLADGQDMVDMAELLADGVAEEITLITGAGQGGCHPHLLPCLLLRPGKRLNNREPTYTCHRPTAAIRHRESRNYPRSSSFSAATMKPWTSISGGV